MSIDYHVYVGPAVRVIPKWELVELRGCVKEGCKRLKDHVPNPAAQFCALCGSTFGTFTDPKRRCEVINDYDLFDRKETLHSALTSDGATRIFMPNTSRTPRDFCMDPHGDEVDQVLEPDAIKKEIAWMYDTYSPEIIELEKTYGANCVAVQWVFFSWTS